MKMRITVEGKTYDVDVEILEETPGDAPSAPVGMPAHAAPPSHAPPKRPASSSAPAPVSACDENRCVSPLPGTVLKVLVAAGDTVEPNQNLFVLDAMKMETSIPSPRAGKVKTVHVSEGKAVKEGEALLEFE